MRRDIPFVVIPYRCRCLKVVRGRQNRPRDCSRLQVCRKGCLSKEAPVPPADNRICGYVPHPSVIHLILVVICHFAGVVLTIGVGQSRHARAEPLSPPAEIATKEILTHGISGRLFRYCTVIARDRQGCVALLLYSGIHPGGRGDHCYPDGTGQTVFHRHPAQCRAFIGSFIGDDAARATHQRGRLGGGGEAEGVP